MKLEDYPSAELVILQTAVSMMVERCPEDRVEILKTWVARIQDAAVSAGVREIRGEGGLFSQIAEITKP